MVDDGIAGERVTPTGAAILRHLCASEPTEPASPRVLVRSGIGFGAKVLPGISNCVRALVFDAANEASPSVRVKTVERSGGRTAKAEADDAALLDGHAPRAELKHEAERLALCLDEEPS